MNADKSVLSAAFLMCAHSFRVKRIVTLNVLFFVFATFGLPARSRLVDFCFIKNILHKNDMETIFCQRKESTMNEQTEMQTWTPPDGALVQAPALGAITPAQARVDAVSTVLHAAIQRASTLDLTTEQVQALKADFPDEAFKAGAAGKEHLIYIEHAFLRDRLDDVIGMGKWAIIRTRPHWGEEYQTGKREQAVRVYAECALVVKGCFVSEAIGEMTYFPNNPSQNYGDAAEGAVTAAFRRCCKNFGVGLQAWKKDFADGWKRRQQSGTPRNAPQSSYTAPPAPTAPKAPQERPAATAQQVVGGASSKTRGWMLAKLKDTFSILDIQNYAVARQFIQKGGTLNDWPLNTVPTTGPAYRDLAGKIQAWIDSKQAPDTDAPPEDFIPGAEVPPVNGDDFSEGFWNAQICVPRAGMKRAEYVNNPDTIRSLYEATKGGDQKARQRLFGLAKEWSPQPWVDQNGNTRQPSKGDTDCREALDTFLDWHETKGGEQ